VDSSVGGKTGVNHLAGKNMIGAFYQPTLVCIDPETLLTLPEREFRSGLFEVIKYGLIYDAEFFAFLELELEKIQRRVPEVLEKVVARCCEIKSEVTTRDEKELDLRRILNLGHTFGHGLEAACQFQRVTHGEAVAYGMIAASHLSQRMGLLDADSCQRIVEAIRRVGDLPSIDTVPTQEVLDAMKLDKKRRGDRTVVVLLEEIGRAVIRDDVPLDDLRQVWDRIKSEPAP
jgi:3-dehydroquinate synthetase